MWQCSVVTAMRFLFHAHIGFAQLAQESGLNDPENFIDDLIIFNNNYSREPAEMFPYQAAGITLLGAFAEIMTLSEPIDLYSNETVVIGCRACYAPIKMRCCSSSGSSSSSGTI